MHIRGILSILFLAVASFDATAATSAGLVGRWNVTWDNTADNNNAVTLSAREDRLSGTYTNDSQQLCPVTGNFDPNTNLLALQVVCPDWDIRLEGAVSPDGTAVTGRYRAYVNDQGEFSMSKL